MTKRVDTKLARVRGEAAAIRQAGAAAPLTFVVPPIAQILGTVQAVAGNEVQAMLARQTQEPDSRLSAEDAKKLATLTDAIVKAHSAEKALGEQELGALTDEELNAEFLKALETERAKRGPGT